MARATRETDSDGSGDRAGGPHPLIGKLERALAQRNSMDTERFLRSICGRPGFIAANLGDVERMLSEHGQIKLLEAAILNSLAVEEHPRRILRQLEDFARRHKFLDAFELALIGEQAVVHKHALAQETVIAEPPGRFMGEPETIVDRAEPLAGQTEVDPRAGQSQVDVDTLLPQALSLLQAADNMGAAAVLERLVAVNPGDATMRARLATAYLRAVVQIGPDDPAEAERLLLRVLELDVTNKNARVSYAKLLHGQGRHLEVTQRLGGVPSAGESEMHFSLGAKAYRARDYVTAANHLGLVLAANPLHSQAMRLMPNACYRSGRTDHPSLDPMRRELSGKLRFAGGLNTIARAVGVEAAADDGGLPGRAGWTEAQRYDWGRRVDALIRYQVLGGPDTLADLQRRTRPLALPPELREGGAVILLLHVGSVSLAIGQIVASGIPYKLVTNSISYGLAFPDQVIDAGGGRANTLLAQMGMALRRRVCLVVAADGPLGQRVDGFEHKGVEYSIAAGPLALAQMMQARTHLLVGGYEERSLACRIVEGPPAGASLETLHSFWGSAIRAEVERVTDLGPENYIQHASSSTVAMTTRRYRPA